MYETNIYRSTLEIKSSKRAKNVVVEGGRFLTGPTMLDEWLQVYVSWNIPYSFF